MKIYVLGDSFTDNLFKYEINAIKNAIKNSKKQPDIIYHRGDFGKEPMIILFGETPDIVIKKIIKII